jgi:hypothetical protein
MAEDTSKALAPAELAEARAALARARGRKRLDVILESRAPQALVRALPADDLYLLVREVGLSDAAPIVQLASAAQFKVFLDLAAWPGGTFDVGRALPWLRAARAGATLEPRAAARWARKLHQIDGEVLFLILRATLRVHDLEQDPDPELASDRFMRTPEGKFVVEFTVGGTEYAAVRGLLDDLNAENPFETTRMLLAIRWETPSDLEESALRWRAGRLADLGFPPLEEALSWFARPPRAPAAHAPGAPARPAGFFLATLDRGTLLDRAAALLDPPDRARVEAQMVAAANAVLVADGVDPGDLDAVRGAFESARGYLLLGLEKLAGDGDERAADALAQTPVKRIFQEGFGRVLELRWRAERILGRAGDGARFGAPLDEALAALASRRPRYFPGVETPRAAWGTVEAAAHEARHFRSSDDLARTAAALDAAEAILADRGGP